MKDKVRKYISITGLVKSVSFMIIFLISIEFLLFTGDYFIERFTKQSAYFEYVSIEPIKESFKEGEDPAFESISEIKRKGEITRRDYAYCENDIGIWKSRIQERGPEFQEVRAKKVAIRSYTEEIRKDVEKCTMCGTVTMNTKRFGFKKNYTYCTKRFGVNK